MVEETKDLPPVCDRRERMTMLVTVSGGTTTDSMIDEGIPKVIEWLKRLSRGE